MPNISAPVGVQNQRPNISDYVTTAKAATGAELTASDVGNLFWDLISGGQMSNIQMADYNNRLNEWHYNEYQSPEALARQYEVAGLNRNFSQQGPSGNIQPSASANLHNDTLSNSLRVVQGVNSLLSAVSQGVNITSDILSIPKDQAYKTWRNFLASHNVDIAESKALSALSKAFYDRVYYGGDKIEVDPEDGSISYDRDPMSSPALINANLRNEVMEFMKRLRSYDLNIMKPEQYRLIQNQIESLGTKIGIDKKTLEFFDANNFSKIIAPFLMFLSKFM